MADYCSICGKKLGLLSFKYKSEDGSVMCASCLKKWKEEQEEKDRKIMKEVISKYLADKDPEIRYIERICCEAYWFASFLRRTRKEDISPTYYDDYEAINRIVLDKAIKERPECVEVIRNNMDCWFWERNRRLTRLGTFLDDVKRYEYQEWLNDLESSIKSGLTTTELDEIKGTIKMCEFILDFIEDLEKLGRLFEIKGIKAGHIEILSVFSEFFNEKFNEETKVIEANLDSYKDIIFERLGNEITKKNVIKEFMKLHPEACTNVRIVSILLKKFEYQIKYNTDEVEQLIEQAKEEIELEEFEENLGAPPQKQKNEIGDFTELNGYEFEDHLKNLFELLGYTAVQTALSGDQGADLILSKDDEKVVVQAKKYDGKVSNKAVQEIVAAKNYYDADRTMIVTNSSFTKSAIELAFSNDVELWDGRKLKDIVRDLESKSEESGPLFHETLHFKRGEEVQNVTIPCPCCEKEFDYEIDFHPYLELTEGGTLCGAGKHELEINCPYCDFPFGISFEVPLKPLGWGCSFCGKEFETKAAAEEHEKICGKRKEKG